MARVARVAGAAEPGRREADSGEGSAGPVGSLFSAGEIRLGEGGFKSLEKVGSGGRVGR